MINWLPMCTVKELNSVPETEEWNLCLCHIVVSYIYQGIRQYQFTKKKLKLIMKDKRTRLLGSRYSFPIIIENIGKFKFGIPCRH